MRKQEKSIKRTGIIWLLLLLFILMKVENQKIISGLTDRMNILSGYIKSQGEEGFTAKNMIHSYMPVVGYVDSHYVDTGYLADPSYEYEEQVEYITLDETTGVEEAQMINAETNSTTETESQSEIQSQSVQQTVSESQTASIPAMPQVMKMQKSELLDFNTLLNNFYTVTSITELKEDKFDLGAALEQDMTIQGDNSSPQILIFHTHSQEGFVDSVEGDNSTGIVGVGARLAEILSSKYGYNVIHDTSVYDYVGGVLDRSKAYTYAEQGIQQILEQYPTVEVVLDIHRDGVAENIRLVTDVNGKPTAKMMFFNGISYTKVNGEIDYLYNPYIQDNLAMSLQMYLLGKSYYPDVMRKIYIHGYRYCLHFRPKSMLIEVGAQNNTLEEELNAMEPLAEMLDRLFRGEKGYE